MTTNYSYSAGADRLTLRNNLYTDLRRHRIGFGLTDSTGPFPNASLDAVLQQQARIQSPWNMTDVNLQELVGAYGADQLFGQHYDEPQTVSQINAINDPNGEVQRYRRNGVPELLTVSWSSELINGEYAGWSANVDIFAGVHYALIPFSNAQKKLNEGKAVWSYSAGMQPNEAPPGSSTITSSTSGWSRGWTTRPVLLDFCTGHPSTGAAATRGPTVEYPAADVRATATWTGFSISLEIRWAPRMLRSPPLVSKLSGMV